MKISITPTQEVVTSLSLGASSPKLGGVVNVERFTDLQGLFCYGNDLAAVTGYENNSNLATLLMYANNLTGTLPSDLSNMTNLNAFYCNENQLTGPLPNLNGLSNLFIINCGDNQLSGPIPDISTFGLTTLIRFNIYGNNFTGTLTGFQSGAPSLQWIYCYNNNFTGFTGGVPGTLFQFLAFNNNFTQTAIDNILQAFVDAGSSNGTLNVGGTGNSTPSAAGTTNKNTLIGRGWSVTTN